MTVDIDLSDVYVLLATSSVDKDTDWIECMQ